MRILHLSKGYYSFGGIEKVVRDWHRTTDDMDGFESIVVAMDNCIGSDENVIACSYGSILKQPFSVEYILAYLKSLKKVEVIHVHLPNYWAIIAVLLLRRNKRLIIHWHSDVIGKGLGVFLRFLENWLVFKSEKIIFTSESYSNSSYIRKIAGSKAKVVPLTCRQIKGNINVRSKYNGKFLFVGRFVPYKGFELLFETVLLLGLEDNFVFVGAETGELVKLMRKNTEYSKLDIRLGIGSDELGDILKASRCLVLPSITRAEAFGIVAIEAMSTGTPLITTSLFGSGLNEINIHNKTGFKIEVGDLEDLKEKILLMNNLDFEEYQVLSKNSIERWKNYYSEDILREYIYHTYNTGDCDNDVSKFNNP